MIHERLYVYDIDDTLILQEDIKSAMDNFRRLHGYVPKMNWLASPQSFMYAQFNEWIRPVVEQSNNDTNGRVAVISNRVETLEPAVRDLMKRLGVRADYYLLRPVDRSSPLMKKSERLKHLLTQHNFNVVYVYDDDPRQLVDFESIRDYMEDRVDEYVVVHARRD